MPTAVEQAEAVLKEAQRAQGARRASAAERLDQAWLCWASAGLLAVAGAFAFWDAWLAFWQETLDLQPPEVRDG